ncbi:hypothetical protein NSK_003186 [Nannochloropsis salina CCMP1776]|uniref:Uncharacterized protein n=1 Tax=Nannochloropsis salina CCMP1776 TaxID=1027361 RepID=A0A4D9DAN6_9STRA|nr:hypothetical protein NSK_003186 [Nannochloropsis salina CCMP1776]|eukprot:TFJ85678.1 hypothetical protein NSK_003186 [Nannochloropsis salina CCMP1776]
MFRAATSTNDSGSTGGDEASCSWLSASSDPSVPAAALTRTGGDGTTLFGTRRVMALCLLSLVSLAAGAPCLTDGGGWSTSTSKTLTGFLRPSTSAPVTPLCGGFRPGQRRELLSPRGVSYTGTSTGSSHMSSPVVVQLNHSSVAITEESSAYALPPSQAAARRRALPKPANLPGLSKEDLILLRAGQRVQHQIRNGCVGSGYVVVDVLADSATVWNTLLGFERYADMIPTIRKVKITSRWPALTKGLFTLSKFRFRLSVVHKHAPEENRLNFYLDPDCQQYRSILEMAEGFWYIEDQPADRPEGWTRVYMSATVKVNSLVPMWLVDYAAERALKRATSWLKPYVEQNRGETDRSGR